jgi:hypothetical protein
MYGYTNDTSYRDKAEQTMEVFAGSAEQFGIFGATYGIAAVHFSQPHTQIVVIGEDANVEALLTQAKSGFFFNKTVLRLSDNEIVPQNLPPALAETLPNMPTLRSSEATAIVCSNFACQPPIHEAQKLAETLHESMIESAA